MIGIILFQLLGYDMGIYAFNSIINLEEERHIEILKKLINQNIEYEKIFYGTLEPDPKKRIGLKQIIKLTQTKSSKSLKSLKSLKSYPNSPSMIDISVI